MSDDRQNALGEIQQQIDENTATYVKEDFKLKLSSHKKILEVLEKRDRILKEEFTRKELESFFEKVFMSFDPLQEFVPVREDNTYDFSFIRFIKAEYLDGYKMKVTLELYENEYIDNKVLEKTMHVYEGESEGTKIIWKNEKGSCPLFDFFESEDDDFEAFDIFYELYIDLLFLSDIVSDE